MYVQFCYPIFHIFYSSYIFLLLVYLLNFSFYYCLPYIYIHICIYKCKMYGILIHWFNISYNNDFFKIWKFHSTTTICLFLSFSHLHDFISYFFLTFHIQLSYVWFFNIYSLGILNLSLIVSAGSFMSYFFLCFMFFDCDIIDWSQSLVSLSPKFWKLFSRNNL